MAIFMTIPDVEGECTTRGFEKQMELWSLSLGAAQSANYSQSSGWSDSEAHLSPISITKSTDKATPILLEKCCEAAHFKEITFSLTRTANKKIETYMKVVLTDALIADMSFGANAEDAPSETISLVYTTIEWEYGKIQKTGSAAGNTAGAWNIGTGDREI